TPREQGMEIRMFLKQYTGDGSSVISCLIRHSASTDICGRICKSKDDGLTAIPDNGVQNRRYRLTTSSLRSAIRKRPV
ncbi:TPA: hypothetical protein ACWXSI_005344, partial [Escherichia coli]